MCVCMCVCAMHFNVAAIVCVVAILCDAVVLQSFRITKDQSILQKILKFSAHFGFFGKLDWGHAGPHLH